MKFESKLLYEYYLNNIQKLSLLEKTFEITSYFESYILDTVLRAFFAIEIDSINNSSNPLVFNPKKIFNKI
jgi:hypothetical protein